jgi:N-methylhydantoinase A
MEAAIQRSAPGTPVAFERFAEIRYRGQVHSMRTPLAGFEAPAAVRSRFESIYKARYGHADSRNPVEIVNLSVVAQGRMDQPDLRSLAPSRKLEPGLAEAAWRRVYFGGIGFREAPVWRREHLPCGFAGVGPALIEEYGSTTVVGPGDRFEIGALGEIQIRLSPALAAKGSTS